MKNNKTLKSGSGVGFYRNVEMTCKKKPGHPCLEQAVNLGLLFLAVYSTLFMFIHSLQISIRPSLFTAALFLEIVLVWASLLKKSIRIITVPVLLLVFVLLLFINLQAVREGFTGVANTLIRNINSYYEVNISELSGTADYNLLRLIDGGLEQRVQTIFLLFAAFGAVLLQAAVICAGGSRWLFFLSALPFAACPFAVGLVPQAGYLLGFFLAAAAVVGNGFRIQPEVRAKTKVLLLTAAGLSCIFASMLLPRARYAKYHVENVKQEMQDGMQSFLEGDFLGLSIFPGHFRGNGGLSGGKLGEVDSVSFRNKEALEITLPEEVLDKFYLRGFIGNEYTSESWTVLEDEDEEMREYQGLKEITGGELANLQSQKTELAYRLYHEVIKILPPKEEWNSYTKEYFDNSWIASDTKLLTIKNKQRGDKTFYAPYLVTEALEPGGDGRLAYQGKSRRDYKLDFLNEWEQLGIKAVAAAEEEMNMINLNGLAGNIITENGRMDELFDLYLEGGFGKTDSLAEDIASYRKREDRYYDYVEALYTKMPVKGAEKTLAAFEDYMKGKGKYFSYSPGTLDKAVRSMIWYANAADRIKSFLNEHAVYDLSPGRVPEGSDFIDYFLFENKKGYCSYYATAATVLFRSMGIPARYVEGYVVTRNDLLNAKKNGGSRKATIKDTNAHAWTEIYMKGWGWIPVEVTPGFGGNGLPDKILFNNIKEAGERGVEANPYASVKPGGDKPIDTAKNGTIKQPAPHKKLWFEKLPFAVRLLLLLLAVAAAAVLGIFLRAKWLNLKGSRILSGKNCNKKQIYLYGQLERMLGQACYMGADFILEEQYKEIYKIIPGRDELERFVDTSRKAAFGSERVSREEWERSRSFYRQCKEAFYQNTGRYRRFYYRYIRCYY